MYAHGRPLGRRDVVRIAALCLAVLTEHPHSALETERSLDEQLDGAPSAGMCRVEFGRDRAESPVRILAGNGRRRARMPFVLFRGVTPGMVGSTGGDPVGRRNSCRGLVLVDEPAQHIPPANVRGP